MDKVRINLNTTQAVKDKMQAAAEAQGLTLTDYIIARCTAEASAQDPADASRIQQQLDSLQIQHANAMQMYDQQLSLLQSTLRMRQADYEQLKADHTALQQRYDFTLQAMVWHSLPWWRKLVRPIELPNNLKDKDK